ncbi:hypothetical protein VC891_20835, partial [Citrobacter freundii]|nr:hypothetical protein [Citrobacter freundii]
LQNKWVLKLQDPGFGTRRYSDDAYDSSDFIDRWTVLFGLAIVVGSGLIYMFLTRPFGRSAAPENDAIAYASKLNMGQDN